MANLFEELKRRNVFRVAGFYLVVAWLLIQIADTIAPMMNLPEVAPRLVLFLLIIMFPIALFLAWAYEITPEGIRPDDGTLPPSSQSRAGRSTTVMTVFVLLVAGTVLYFLNRPVTESEARSVAPTLDKSIAVLPFTAFSNEQNDQYFADGLSDTLLAKLAQLDDIKVISRSSSFQYRGEAVDVREVGQALGVATVLEGSVQRSGDRLRIIAQLVNTGSGSNIWSETFDRTGGDIFAIHDQIADAVVTNLQVSLSPGEQAMLTGVGTTSVAAYNLYLEILARFHSIPIFELSQQQFEREAYQLVDELNGVLELDPNFAESYRLQSAIFSTLDFQATDATADAYHRRKGFEALNQAMLLEPDNRQNFIVFADLLRRNGDVTTAEVFARMAFSSFPNDPEAIVALTLTLLQQSKNAEERLTLAERERELNPGNRFNYRRRLSALRDLGRVEDAMAVLNQKLQVAPEDSLAAFDLSLLQGMVLGQPDRVMATLAGIRARSEGLVSDTFLRGWSNMLNVAGLYEQNGRAIEQIAGESRRAAQRALLLLHAGRSIEAVAFLKDEVELLKDPEVSDVLALNCLILRDYTCARDVVLVSAPDLDSRDGRIPSINTVWDLHRAIGLVIAYRQTNEMYAADQLLIAMNAFNRARTVDGVLQWVGPSYTKVEIQLLNGEQSAALQAIREMIFREDNAFVGHWFSSFESPVYDPLRDNPEFEEAVNEYKRRQQEAGRRITLILDQYRLE